MKLTLGQVADWIHAEGDFTTHAEAVGFSIDSRTIGRGELFFAVRGERVDGHDFVQAALRNGAIAAVVSRAWHAPDEASVIDPCKLLWVPENGPPPNAEDNVLVALQTLANRVRRSWGGRVIGVTGSAGKTTTKEAVATVLESAFCVLRSAGNLNNHFGLPLQLLKLEPEHEVAVLEMGMNHAGEITALAKIAEPDWGIVTNVAPVHLEFFPDGLEGIAKAKKELIDALSANGLAFLNADDDRVRAMTGELGERAVSYGTWQHAQVRAEDITEAGAGGVSFTAVSDAKRVPVTLQMLGKHNVYNALAAIAVGLKSGISLEDCATAVSRIQPTENRGAIVEWRGAKVINDCYNSNPMALDAMVNALAGMALGVGGRRIVVAGEMLELGAETEALHRACGARMSGRVDLVVGVRGAARQFGGLYFETPEEAGEWMLRELRVDDVVLLKASRGVRLERALAVLETAAI